VVPAAETVEAVLADRELRQRAAGQGQSIETERQHRRHKQDLRPKIDNGTLEAKVDFEFLSSARRHGFDQRLAATYLRDELP
jgi:hypothetical protein